MASAASAKGTWIAFGSIFRRSLTTQTITRTRPCKISISPQVCPGRCLLSQAWNTQRLPRKNFSVNHGQQSEHQYHDGKQQKTPKRKAARSSAGAKSLRRVAVEAQRSQGSLIRGKGKTRHVDPDADTKDVTAYCAAETYNIHIARDSLQREGYKTDPFHTSLFPQVLHVQTTERIVDRSAGSGEDGAQEQHGDVFVFPSGTVVTWNVSEKRAHNLVENVLLRAAENSHPDTIEVEDLEYLEDGSEETSSIVGDTIILGTKTNTIGSHNHDLRSVDSAPANSAEVDRTLVKIAFSSALARSTKLAVLENLLDRYFSTTRSIPATLGAGTPLRITRAFILRKTGELLTLRAQLNLYSELTDALPDLFWDSPYELGLEGHYETVGRALDVGVRIRALNEKMDYASEIAAVLRERLSEKHSTGLEWMIIGLITIEVGFGVLHLWRESVERDDRRRTEGLLQEYLERELGRPSVDGVDALTS